MIVDEAAPGPADALRIALQGLKVKHESFLAEALQQSRHFNFRKEKVKETTEEDATDEAPNFEALHAAARPRPVQNLADQTAAGQKRAERTAGGAQQMTDPEGTDSTQEEYAVPPPLQLDEEAQVKRHRPILRFQAADRSNNRKNDPANAQDFIDIAQLGSIGERPVPPGFETTMLVDAEPVRDAETEGSVIQLPPITLTKADWQGPHHPNIRINTADNHKLILALGRGPEVAQNWAWQMWRQSEIARGKTEAEFELLGNAFKAVHLPTWEALLHADFTG